MDYINAKITSTKLGCLHDRGIMTFWINLEWQSCGQGFGGYVLDSYDKNHSKRVQTELTGEIIYGILTALGLDSWEDLKGQYVRIAVDKEGFNQKILGIGHIVEDKFFYVEEIFKSYREKCGIA